MHLLSSSADSLRNRHRESSRPSEWLEAEGQRETVETLETFAHQLEPTVKPKRGKKKDA